MSKEYPALICPYCGYGWLIFYLPGEDYDMRKPELTKFEQNAIVRLVNERWFCTVCRREWDDHGKIFSFGNSKIIKSKDTGGPDLEVIQRLKEERENAETTIEKTLTDNEEIIINIKKKEKEVQELKKRLEEETQSLKEVKL